MTSIIPTIKAAFDKVISYSQSIENPQTEELLNRWLEAKKFFIKRWDNQLIKDCGPITFELGSQEKERRINEFIEFIDDCFGNNELANFIAFNKENFFTNRTVKDFICANHTVVPAGMKIVKAFKFFEEDEAILKDLQTRASMIIQEDKIHGTLCLSVHPLDFLSASENVHNWRSCHALDGEYRSGNLSYMLDKTTIICYLRNDDNELVKLPSFPADVPWNSKKWRMWLFIEDTEDALFAGRQYPFFSPQALEAVKKSYIEDSGQMFWSEWHDDYISEFKYSNTSDATMPWSDETVLKCRHVILGGKIYPIRDLVTDAPESTHFNDLTSSSYYIPYYCWHKYPHSPKRNLHFSIGSAVPCIYCGNKSIRLENSMLCLDCGAEQGEGEDDYFAYCACCNTRLPRESLEFLSGEEALVCENCYSETKTCGRCGQGFFMHNLHYRRDTHQYECDWCSNRYIF